MPHNQQKLHLGCGSVSLTGWLNIDLDTPTADMHLDFTQPLPFLDASITHIFSEHFIEHITRVEAVNFLKECRRILSINGVLRLATPSLRYLATSYLAGNKDEWGDLWQPDSNCLMINEGMRSWGHQFLYDGEELIRVLIEAGFNSISFQEYRKSHDTTLCDLESRPFHNELIVEARVTQESGPKIDRSVLNENENIWSMELINMQSNRLLIVEQTIVDQKNLISSAETELASSAQLIAELDQANASQAHRLQAADKELLLNNQEISSLKQAVEQQTTQISVLTIALLKFQNSICGKCITGVSRLRSFIKRS